jgi:hypothetical protein
MLSKHNVDKLNMNGLYTCEPNVKYRGKLYERNLYHCCNWTFDVIQDREGNYYMRDTYWGSSDSLQIPLTDENIGEFELLFDRTKVKSIKKHEINHYENFYCVGIDSGGRSYPKYFVDMDATKSKSLIIEEIDEKIRNLEWELNSLREKKVNIESGTYDLEWY